MAPDVLETLAVMGAITLQAVFEFMIVFSFFYCCIRDSNATQGRGVTECGC